MEIGSSLHKYLTTLKITISSTFSSGLGGISVRVSGNTMGLGKTRNLPKKKVGRSDLEEQTHLKSIFLFLRNDSNVVKE